MNENWEQTNLLLNYDNELTKVCELRRKKEPIISKVEVDEFTNEANKNFDFDFDGENKFYPFEFPYQLKDLDFNILCIVGASGSGKSIFSKYFGEEEKIEWNNNKAIISNFENVEEAVEKLNSVGLNSIPTWCKPRNVLSVGEGFRADLARRIKDNCVIDEYTSVVDRNVAISCSNSIQKYIRKKNLKRCVFVSCHKDFIDTLRPDYVIDLDDEVLYDTRRLPKRNFKLSIYETSAKQQIWKLFRRHHYLSSDLNIASRVFIAFLNKQIVGLIAIISFPSGTIQNAFRVHRLVVLPDYQGMGIATNLLNYFANLHAKLNCKFYIKTTHPKLINYLTQNKKWEKNKTMGKEKAQKEKMHWKFYENRHPISFKYKYDYDKELDKKDINLYITEKQEQNEINENQTTIFDFIK